MSTPRDIVRRLRACKLPPESVAFVHLGQLGFLIRLGRTVIGCDLFLSPMKGRLVPPQLAPEEVADVDLFIGTHDHADHIDRPLWRALAQLGTKARFIVPDAVRSSVVKGTALPASQVIGMDDGDMHAVAGVRVNALAAAHERIERDRKGRCLALGFVLEAGGARVFHSGDCCPYDGLIERVKGCDAALMPINGRDYFRTNVQNIIGCFDSVEAIMIAKEAGIGVLLPGHFDLYDCNMVNPAYFVDCIRRIAPGQKYHIFQPGERYILQK